MLLRPSYDSHSGRGISRHGFLLVSTVFVNELFGKDHLLVIADDDIMKFFSNLIDGIGITID